MTVTFGAVYALAAWAYAAQFGETPLSAALIGFVLGCAVGLALNLAATGRVWPRSDASLVERHD